MMKLTEEEKEQRMKLYREGRSYKEIAKILYLTEGTVKNWLYRQGVSLRSTNGAEERCQRMRRELPTLEAFEQAAGGGTGAVYEKVAVKYGIARSVAYHHWRELRRLGN